MTTSNLTVGQITGSATNSGVINLPTANKIVGADSGSIRAPGTILQVVNNIYTGQFATSSAGTGYVTVPGLTTTITPLYSSSKILVQLNGSFANYTYQFRGNIKRNGTVIAAGAPAGSRPPVTFMFNNYDGTLNTYNIYTIATSILDAPASTSTQTYTVEIGSYSTDGVGGFTACNRNYQWQNFAEYDALPVSTMTLMEVAA